MLCVLLLFMLTLLLVDSVAVDHVAMTTVIQKCTHMVANDDDVLSLLVLMCLL